MLSFQQHFAMEKLPPQLWCYFSPKLGQKFPRPAMPIIPIYTCSKLNLGIYEKYKSQFQIHARYILSLKMCLQTNKEIDLMCVGQIPPTACHTPPFKNDKDKRHKKPQYVVSYLRNVLTTLKKNWVKHSRRGRRTVRIRDQKGPIAFLRT